jgi:hypothetical protein
VATINHYPVVYVSALAGLMFTKNLIPQFIIVNMFCTKFCPNWMTDTENLGADSSSLICYFLLPV